MTCAGKWQKPAERLWKDLLTGGASDIYKAASGMSF